MLSHIHIGITDFARAADFYRAVMRELGYPLKFVDHEKGWAAWKPSDAERPLFIIGHPYDGGQATPGAGQMVALLAPDRGAVDRAYAAAMDKGAKNEGAPGLRPHYHRNYYGAYFRDPDGNKLCVVCHKAETEVAS
jgi:catechol 2,3-dioxygenase-like lactoylglutathione lyase family enzyme